MTLRLLSLFSLVFFLGCETESATETATPAQATKTGPAPRFPVVPANLSERETLPNNSLTTADYIRLGLPSPDRPWVGAEFTRIAPIIGQLAEDDATQLPRFQSPKSGDVFARLVAHESYAFYRNSSVPLQQRIQDVIAHTQGLNKILWRYIAISTQRSGLGSEIVELAGAQMRLSVLMQELTTELLPQLDPNDRTYPTRMQGLKTMKNGFAMTFSGGLQMLAETDRYEIADLQRLLGHLQATLPEMMPHLSAGSQLENLVKIEALKENAEIKELMPGLEKLSAQLKSQQDTRQQRHEFQ